jgi:hypothetical protein
MTPLQLYDIIHFIRAKNKSGAFLPPLLQRLMRLDPFCGIGFEANLSALNSLPFNMDILNKLLTQLAYSGYNERN